MAEEAAMECFTPFLSRHAKFLPPGFFFSFMVSGLVTACSLLGDSAEGFQGEGGPTDNLISGMWERGDGWMDRCVRGQMNGWMSRWINGWMNVWTDV